MAFGLLAASGALAHGVAEGDAQFLRGQSGFHFWAYAYLGAKHMVTGYDHLLFLVGVVFFLRTLKDVALYVTLFAIGHSVTLVFGALLGTGANVYIVDAVIGLSVVWKALDNLGAFANVRNWPRPQWAVFAFGLCHGLGLATKLEELSLAEEGLLGNLLAFNLGVEVGQLLALSLIVVLLNVWRKTSSFARHATLANTLLMSAGFVLVGYQLTGYFVTH